MTTTNDKIRNLIDSCGSRFTTVDVVLKDGTRRSITFNPRETRPLLTETPTPAGLKAAETRKVNNPTLINVWDRGVAKVRKYGKPGPSSFYLDRVLAVRARGQTHEFRIHRPHIVELAEKD